MVRKTEQIWKDIPEQVKFAFKATMIIGMIVHLFMLTNKLPNHDDLGQMFDPMERSMSGRWFLTYPASISGELSIAFAGVLGIIYVSISAAVLIAILPVKSKTVTALICGLMVSFPTIAGTLCYMNSADAYFFGLMLALIAVYLTVKKRAYAWVLAVLCLTLSLGIYQAYFPFAIAILIIIHMLMLLSDEIRCVDIVKSGLKSIVILIASIALYFVKVKYDQIYGGLKLTSYKGIDQMGKISLEELPNLIVNAYTEPLRFFVRDSWKMHYDFIPYIFGLALLIAIFLAFYLLSKTTWDRKEKKVRFLLMTLLLLVLPLGAGSIFIMVPSNIHMLMIYGYISLLILPLVLVEYLQKIMGENTKEKTTVRRGIMVLEGVVLCMATVLVLNYAVLTNQAYFQLNQTYEQTYAYSNRLISRIEQTEGFSKDKKIVLIGKPDVNTNKTMSYAVKNGNRNPLKEQLAKFTGLVDTYTEVANYYKFLKHYLGVEQEIIVISKREQLEEIGFEIIPENFANYPEKDSIKIVDDKVIVKFSDI